MADEPTVGSASVDVVPSLEGFKEKVSSGTADLPNAKVKVEPDTTGFAEETDAKVDAALRPRDARGRFVKVGVDVDTAEATTKLAALDAEIDKTNAKSKTAGDSSGYFGSSVGLLAGSIALALPLLPELTAGIVSVGGALAVAGAGLVSFGAVALTDITNATNATSKLQQAQQAVDDATTKQARSDALIKQKALIDSIGPSTIALGGAITALGTAWKGFAAGFTPEVTRDVTAFAGILTTALPLLQPIVSAGARAVSSILNDLNTALEGPAAKQFFTWIAGAAETDILDLAKAFGGFGAGVLELFQAFSPIETLVVQGLAGMGTAFSTWASHLSETQGFQKFLQYAAQNGPLVTTTLADVASAGAHILAALTPLLPPMLQIVDFFANLIKNLPVADLTVAAIATGGLVLLNNALEFLIGTSLGGIPTLLGFAGAEDTVGASATAASTKVGGLIGLIGRLAAIKLPAILGGAVGATALTYGPALLTSGDDTQVPSGRKATIAQQFLSTHPIGPNTSQADLSAAITAQAYLATGTVGQYLIPGQPGSSWSNSGATSLSVGNLTTWASLYGTPAEQAQYAKLFGQAPTTFNAINPQLTNTGQIGPRGNALTRADASDANINAIGYGSTYNPSSAGGTGTGNPTLPLSGGSNAAATAAANNAAGIAGLLGLNLMQSLAQGITTGTNPLTEAFQNINLKLTGPAQTLGTQLQTIFTNALQLGQQAAQSLAFNVTAAPTVGSYTSIYMDAQGHSTTTTQSPLIGSAINTLLTDQNFVADINKAKALGLSTSLLSQFVSAGPSSLPTLQALVGSGKGAVAQLDQENASITALGNSFGLQVAGDQYGPQVVTTLEQIRDLLEAAPEKTGAATGAHVAANLDKTSTKAITKAATTGPRGPFGRAQ